MVCDLLPPSRCDGALTLMTVQDYKKEIRFCALLTEGGAESLQLARV